MSLNTGGREGAASGSRPLPARSARHLSLSQGEAGNVRGWAFVSPILHYLLTVPPELFPVYIHTGGEAAHHTPHGQRPCQT